jgi:hypothetical protein
MSKQYKTIFNQFQNLFILNLNIDKFDTNRNKY